jgi:hypothetical protein
VDALATAGGGDGVIMKQLTPGLFRWTALHPDWRPECGEGEDGWEQTVGCVMYDLGESVVLIDPLIPDERDSFLNELDERVAGRPVSILTTIRFHRRDRAELAGRYSSTTTRAWNAVPRGVSPRPLRGASETAYWLPAVAALVFGDSVIGAPGGGLRVSPESWLKNIPAQTDRAGLAELLRPLLELAIELVLVSHGEPVLHDGRAALAHAIAQARAQAGLS